MTSAELGTALDDELDKAGTGWFTPTEKSYFLNRAYEKLLDEWTDQIEASEKARRVLQKLLTDSPAQVGSVFDLTAIADLNRIVAVIGDFTVSCKGNSQSIERRIRPIANDSLEKQSPFGRGTNSEPTYEEVNSQLRVQSDTAPTSVIVRYIKQFTPIDITLDPLAVPEIQDSEQRKIVYYARDAMLDNLESQRYQTAKNETISN